MPMPVAAVAVTRRSRKPHADTWVMKMPLIAEEYGPVC